VCGDNVALCLLWLLVMVVIVLFMWLLVTSSITYCSQWYIHFCRKLSNNICECIVAGFADVTAVAMIVDMNRTDDIIIL